MKLKTLKELPLVGIMVPNTRENVKGCPCNHLVLEEHIPIIDLKESAIEDIKELEKERKLISHLVPLNQIEYMSDLKRINELIGTINYIKEKFNITEEDLK